MKDATADPTAEQDAPGAVRREQVDLVCPNNVKIIINTPGKDGDQQVYRCTFSGKERKGKESWATAVGVFADLEAGGV